MTPQDRPKTNRGGTEENRSLSERDLIDLALVRRRINGSTYEDGEGRLFVILYPIETAFITSVLSRLIGDANDAA